MGSGTLTGTGTIVGDTYVYGTYGSQLNSSGIPSAEKITVTGALDIGGLQLVAPDLVDQFDMGENLWLFCRALGLE